MSPLAYLGALWGPILHGEQPWCPPEPGPGDVDQCRIDREQPDPEAPVVDMLDEAARAVYGHNGKSKRYRYPPVDLAAREVIVVVHQAGFEVGEGWPWWKLSAHTTITPKARRARLHPYSIRLVAANRLDRAPYHAISIEVAGNFEGLDGSGNWWGGPRQGRGRASDAQIRAVRAEMLAIERTARAQGWEVFAVAPHRISGRNRKGQPDRPICCGSRLHAETVEWAGAELGWRVPADGFAVGGMPVDPRWHGPYWDRCVHQWR